MKITTTMVKELRDATGAGVLEAKKMLEANGGDFDKAVAALREKGLARAARRADRIANEGVVEQYTHPGNRIGVMLELNCETDFVGRNEQFRALAHDLALHIAAMKPRYLDQQSIPQAELERKQAEFKAEALADGKPEAIAERIVAGRLARFYEESCLLEQPFVKDDSVKVKELITEAVRVLGEHIVLRRFVRYELGEFL